MLVLVRVDVISSRQQIVRKLPLLDMAGCNPASCLEKNAPTPAQLLFMLIWTGIEKLSSILILSNIGTIIISPARFVYN